MKLLREKQFWILLLLSGFVRIYVWCVTPVIGRDGFDFINIAKNFSGDNFYKGLEHAFHPLYSLFISWCSISGIGFVSSGRIVSLVFGILAVIAVYVIGKKMFNPAIAFLSAFLLAVHPYAVRLSVDVMSDSTYYFFYILGFGFGYAAINSKKQRFFLFAGMAASLAYLTRPEGVSVLLLTGVWTVIKTAKGFLPRRSRIPFLKLQTKEWDSIPIKDSIKVLSFLLIGFLIFAFPYIGYLKHETGSWTLTKKKQITEISGIATIATIINKAESQPDQLQQSPILQKREPKPDNKYIQAFYHILLQYADAIHYPIILFLIIGVFNIILNRNNINSNLYIATYAGLFLVILFFLKITAGYASYRHLMTIVLVTLFWAAIGMNNVFYWFINRKWGEGLAKYTINDSERQTFGLSIINSKKGIIFLCLIAALCLPKTLKPHRQEKVVRKEAGIWIKEHHGGVPTILTDNLIIALYADADSFNLSDDIVSYKEIVDYAKLKGVDYLVVTESIIKYCPDFFENINHADIKKLVEFNDKRNKVVIYQVFKDWGADKDLGIEEFRD